VYQPKSEWSADSSLTAYSSARPLDWLTSRTAKLDPKLAAYECRGRIAGAVKELTKAYGVKEACIEENIFRTELTDRLSHGCVPRGRLEHPNAPWRSGVGACPKRNQKAVTGHGASKKEQVGRMVKSVFGLAAELPLDESDAAAVASCNAYDAR
jgi:Holliday junction resolvasome RuvABC endonuclease subunit